MAAAAVCAIVLLPAQPAAAASVGGVRVNASEARVIRLVNAVRGRAGLPALRLAAGYTDVARRWSHAMASRRTLVHNPHLAANVRVSGGNTWRAVGENVAYGYDADSIFHNYMNSPPHRANILSPSYRFLGVGWVESSSGPGFTTLVFSNSYSTRYGRSRVAASRCRADG